MATRKVPRGFIIEPDETGEHYVPYLVRVRDADILWAQEKNIRTILSSYVSATKKFKIVPVNPGTSYHVEKDGWMCEIRSDGFTTISRDIQFTSAFRFTENNNQSITYTDLPLPMLFLKNHNFNVQATMSAFADELKTASINVTPNNSVKYKALVNGSVIEGYSILNLEVISPIYRIPSNFVSVFNGSKVYIKVSGYIPYTVY